MKKINKKIISILLSMNIFSLCTGAINYEFKEGLIGSIVAKENIKEVGNIIYILEFPRNSIFIADTWVNEMFQHQGVGTNMINQLIRFSIEKGFSQIYLEISKYNFNAIRFYKNFGFDFTGEENGAYCEMVLNLI